MKTLLIQPPLYNIARYGKPVVAPYGPPLGIGYIAAYLEKLGLPVLAVDASYLKWEEVERLLLSEAPDIVGVTCLSEQRSSSFRLAKRAKALLPSCKTILGGVHGNFMYRQILTHFPFDAVVLGEGEITTAEIIEALGAGRPLSSVPGLACVEGGKVVLSPPRRVLDRLDDLPFPGHRFFRGSRYVRYALLYGRFEGKDLGKLKFMPVITSRGCVKHCEFCSTTEFWSGRWRHRSPENVADELEWLIRDLGVGFVNFADDIFTVNEKFVTSLCEEILRRKLAFLWDCETHAQFVSPEILRIMKQAGCMAIAYGVESGSDAILSNIHKGSSRALVEQAIRLTREAGIRSSVLLMVGNPGESEATVSETLSLLKETEPDYLTVSITMVFPGTSLHKRAEKKGWIKDDYWLTDRPGPYYTVEHPFGKLQKWQDSLLAAHSRGMERWARRVRSAVERLTGLRITRRHFGF
ncbi:MAG: radical SAM protein, partial [Armatimonadetes bacterium]|nr:radical SAM protein [Armatimonadota bacterium]